MIDIKELRMMVHSFKRVGSSMFLLRKLDVGSCDEFDYGTGFVLVIG